MTDTPRVKRYYPPRLNREDIAKHIQATKGTQWQFAQFIADLFWLRLKRALARGENVNLKGFGRFNLRLTNGWNARGGGKGLPCSHRIPPRMEVRFIPHDELKTKVMLGMIGKEPRR